MPSTVFASFTACASVPPISASRSSTAKPASCSGAQFLRRQHPSSELRIDQVLRQQIWAGSVDIVEDRNNAHQRLANLPDVPEREQLRIPNVTGCTVWNR